MKLHDLKPRQGSRKSRKRVGRGYSAGQGKTAGRGTKGQGARAGSGGKLYHQGGNLPFFRRLPFKRGFTNINRIQWAEVNLDRLDDFPAKADVTPEALLEAGILKNFKETGCPSGTWGSKCSLNIRIHRITRGAQAAIEAAGGSVELIEL